MAHLDFARPGGVWANEFVPGAGDFYRWDIAQSKIVSGDLGGSWAPSSPIILGGAGGSFTTAGTQITGGVRTQTGGRLVLGQHDIVALSPPRERKITMSLLGVKPTALNSPNAMAQFTSVGGNLFTFGPDAYFIGVAPPFGCGLFLANVGQPIAIPIPKAYTHTRGFNAPFDGQLASVTLHYRVLQKPGAIVNNLLASSPFLTVFNQLGPADQTTTPTGYTQLEAAGAFPSPIWRPGTSIATGSYITPAGGGTFAFAGSYFKAIVGGTTGTSFPAWDTTPGALTTDGDLTWRCIGGNGFVYETSVDSVYDNGAPQSVTLNLDTDLPQALDTANNYLLVGINPPQDASLSAPFNTIPIVYTSIQFTYGNIVSLGGWN